MLRSLKSAGWRSALLAFALAFCASTAVAQQSAPQSNPSLDKGSTSPAIATADKQDVLDRINEIVEKQSFVPGVDFTKWPDFLAGERTDIDNATTQREFSTAVNKALHKFGFSHIVLITPEAAQARLSERSVGIGVLLQAESDGMRVLNVFADSPADEAGLQVGDLIILGNGKKPETPLDLQGDEGTDLTIKVKHLNGKTQQYTLTRRKYNNVRPESLTWVDKETAVLRVYTFDVSYSRDHVESLVKQAEDQGAKNLILDLRSNPGGQILNLVHLMGLLLPPGTPLGSFITRTEVDHYVKDDKGKATDLAAIARESKSGKLIAQKEDVPYFKGHIAVLINGASGSASEIAAAALRDDVFAPIVGSKSAGAVLVSIMTQLPHGFMLQYPIMDFVSVNGVRLEGTGVSPDLETPTLQRFNVPDEAVQKAALLLERADLRDEGAASLVKGKG